jgi:hypothetical protein
MFGSREHVHAGGALLAIASRPLRIQKPLNGLNDSADRMGSRSATLYGTIIMEKKRLQLFEAVQAFPDEASRTLARNVCARGAIH